MLLLVKAILTHIHAHPVEHAPRVVGERGDEVPRDHLVQPARIAVQLLWVIDLAPTKGPDFRYVTHI